MIQLKGKNRWAIEARGAFTIFFGLVALSFPHMTLDMLALVFGVYALTEGTLLLTTSFQGRGETNRWMMLFHGLTGIAAGAVTLAWAQITSVGLLLVIAIWSLATGMIELGSALVLRKELKVEWLLILSGLVSILFGYMLLANPAVGALVFISVIGVYAVIYGMLQVVLGSRFHRMFHA